MAEAKHITDLSLKELAQVERTEAELDSFLEKRARQTKDANKEAALWLKTERDYREKRRHQNGLGWIRHHEGLANALRTLAQEHDAKAEHFRGLLEASPPITEKEGEMDPNTNGHAGEVAS